MTETGKSFTMMRTLLLLNSTQRKLQFEDNILDSSSPLKALMLQRVAQSLNDHLHNEQSVHSRDLPQRYHNLGRESIIAEEEVESDEDDQALHEMQTAIEVGQVPPPYDTDVVIEVDEIEDADSTQDQPSETETLSERLRARDTVFEEQFGDADLTETNLSEFDLEDMPSLSRQASHSSIPSLYHSDGDDDEEDEYSDNVNDGDNDQRFLILHHGAALHPATPLFDKRCTVNELDSNDFSARSSIP